MSLSLSLLLSLWLSLYATNLCIFYFVFSCLALPCLCVSGLVLLLLLQAWRCMSSSYITISYHIISYLMFFYFISSADLISIPFYSIIFYSTLFQIDSIWFYSILFYWIWFTILFSIVSHINEWFVSICPSVCLCVYLYE